ncbi:MAG: hypothetical protein ACFCUP_15195 [Actinomycetales bacterium]
MRGGRDPRPGRSYRYGAWRGGPDPLAPPVDVRAAVDALGEHVMQGDSARDALRQLLRDGVDGRRGLRDLQAEAMRRRREIGRRGRLDGAVTRARAQLDQALAAERDALTGRDDDDARFAEARLDALPRSVAQAVQELTDYDWASPEAERLYRRILDELEREVLDQRLGGTAQALRRMAEGGPEADAAARATREMLADLQDLLDKHARGEDTDEDFDRFMGKHGDAFGDDPPETVDELIDELARRAAASERLTRSLSPQQREELQGLMAQALGRDPELAARMAALGDTLRALRPELDWSSQARMRGETPLGYGEAAAALEELGDLEALIDQLGQDHPGATLDDVDVETVERALGRGAADEVARLRRLERELVEQGWLVRGGAGGESEPALSPKAMRRLGQSALRTVFDRLTEDARGEHDDVRQGSGAEPTGSWRAWRFGDSEPIDVVRTVQNAVLRSARADGAGMRPGGRPGRVGLAVEDFAVAEQENRSRAAVALCVDLSFSMIAEGRWAPMKRTALALSHLVATRYPTDALQVIGFGRYARRLTAAELTAAEPDFVQGTNLAHALSLARLHVARHPGATPVVLVVTDGEPTAHLETLAGGGSDAVFHWPPLPETIRATVDEVDRLTRAKVPVNVFMLGEDGGLVRFVDALARRNGGRVFRADPERLGSYVVADYLRARRG